jgi:hypothetical protein
VPVESKMMISSSDVRPSVRPATIAPNSAYTSDLPMTPAAIA